MNEYEYVQNYLGLKDLYALGFKGRGKLFRGLRVLCLFLDKGDTTLCRNDRINTIKGKKFTELTKDDIFYLRSTLNISSDDALKLFWLVEYKNGNVKGSYKNPKTGEIKNEQYERQIEELKNKNKELINELSELRESNRCFREENSKLRKVIKNLKQSCEDTLKLI